MATERVAQLEICPRDRSAGNCPRLASEGVSGVLELEDPARQTGQASGSSGNQAIDSDAQQEQSNVGSTPDSWRTAKARHRNHRADVAKYMVRHRTPPSQTWRSFLANHIGRLVSVDFFIVPTIRFQILYVFLVLAHDRRRILHFAVTRRHPTAEWTAQQMRDAFSVGQR